MWFELAIMSLIFAVGNIFFGHFEERTPKWRRLLKMILVITVSLVIAYYAGRIWFYILLGIMVSMVVVIHGYWLPKKGINGLTAKPRDRYYQLRGWTEKENSD